MEDSIEILQQIRNRTTISTPGYLSVENEITRKDMCTPVFIVALFIIAKIWRQPKCPLIGMDKEDEWTYLDI